MTLFYMFTLILLQTAVPLKASREFEVNTNYELRKKPPQADNTKIVFEEPEDRQKSYGTDLLPYLSVKVKVKRWFDGVTHIKIVDSKSKTHLKRKVNDDGIYELEMGFVDDMKDKVTATKFFVQFIREKKTVEQITIEVEEDGTFLVNGEKRGKF